MQSKTVESKKVQSQDQTPTTSAFSLNFSYSLGKPDWTIPFRLKPEDFQVDEVLGFDPSGEGEHLLLHIQKTNENTRWVAKLLAEYYGIQQASVGYCGLKDRRAVTRQWFSVHKPGPVDLSVLPVFDDCEILAFDRNNRKLRPGMHQANNFIIRLCDLGEHSEEVDRRLKVIAEQGVPNYFGEQRFGIDQGNLVEVEKIVSHRSPRFRGKRGGLYLSSARSWLFNQVLSQRVANNNWSIPVGEETNIDGPLWGRGRHNILPELEVLEAEVLKPWQKWCLALEHSGLKQERRMLVLKPVALTWEWQRDNVVMRFGLPPGCYATSVLRELSVLTVAHPKS